MILARLPPAPFLCELSGKSDPLTDRQIDSLHMAHNLSVVAVIVNMHFFLFLHRTPLVIPTWSEKSSSACQLFPRLLCVFFYDCSVLLNPPMSLVCLLRDRKVTLVHLDSLESL